MANSCVYILKLVTQSVQLCFMSIHIYLSFFISISISMFIDYELYPYRCIHIQVYIHIYIYMCVFHVFHAMEYTAHSRHFRSRLRRKLRPVVPAWRWTPSDALWLRWTVALWWRWYRWSRYGHNPRSYNHDEDGDDDPTYDDKYHGFYLIYVASLLILCWWK